jgi:dienelactone hydrolase
MVYMPDFFAGEQLDAQKIKQGKFHELDMEGFKARNSRAVREPEIFACACARALRESYSKIGAVGYCYGGWAVLSLASTSPP